MNDLLIIGCGYLGKRVAPIFHGRFPHVTVFGTTRSPRKAAALQSLGIQPVIADVLAPATFAEMPLPGSILYCVGFDRSSGHSMRSIYVDGLRGFLNHLETSGWSGRLVYVSTSGVYGQDTGEWVDEDSPTSPCHESGIVCLEAESLVRDFAKDRARKSWILRLTGLYGPDRLVQRDALTRGVPITGDPRRWLNLIHVDDAARACIELLQRETPRALYVASDDRPLHRGEYYATMAGFLGLEPPRFAPPEPGQIASGREATSKRVRNHHLKADLGFSLLYPDITTGIPASLDLDNQTSA